MTYDITCLFPISSEDQKSRAKSTEAGSFWENLGETKSLLPPHLWGLLFPEFSVFAPSSPLFSFLLFPPFSPLFSYSFFFTSALIEACPGAGSAHLDILKSTSKDLFPYKFPLIYRFGFLAMDLWAISQSTTSPKTNEPCIWFCPCEGLHHTLLLKIHKAIFNQAPALSLPDSSSL